MSTLVITVGTSLFTSASWSLDSPFGEIPGYGRWVKEMLEDAAKRRAVSGTAHRRIVERLQARDPGDLAHFEWKANRARRYSAEVTTLLRWMARENADDLKTFLEERYRRIDWVCPSDPGDEARIAADYLAAVFRDRLWIAASETRPVLRSGAIADRVRHFGEYLEGLPADGAVDLIVSGGYKVYAMAASVLAATEARRGRWRVIYVHDSSLVELVVQEYSDGTPRLEIADQVAWSPPRTM